MRHKAIILTGVFAMAALAGVIGGCDAAPAGWLITQDQHAGGPTLSPEAAGILGRQNSAAFDEAVTMAADLRFAEAGDRFSGLALRYETIGDVRRAAEAFCWLGYCRQKQGALAPAADAYRRAQKYPDTPGAVRAHELAQGLPAPPKPGSAATRPATNPATARPVGSLVGVPLPRPTIEPGVVGPSSQPAPTAGMTSQPPRAPTSAPGRKSVLPTDDE